VQERQFSPFDFEQLTLAEQRALRRLRARRVRALVASVGAGILALCSVGCPEPADLQNPNQYPLPPATGGSGSTAGSGTGGSAPAGCETACIKDIFQKQVALCKLCHGAMPAPAGLQSSGLNLESDGFTDRLKNVAAKHTDLPMGKTTCPTGDKLIDTSNPSASWLLKKIQGQQNGCGDPMPSAGTLSADQKTCLETYVSCVAGGSISGGAGSGSGGTASGGTASGGTASGGTGGSASGGTASGGGGASAGGGGGTGGK
jgi:hypothetical protein